MTHLPFSQVDVFSATGLGGNPVAVVHDADGLSDETMAAFARWTNLSETTFLLAPMDPAADYRLRIFTTSGELPFAGHPTLGSAHAWLEAGGEPRHTDRVVQECGAGLVAVRTGERLAFAAPPLLRSGPVAEADLANAVAALGLDASAVVGAAWIDNGPGWMGLELTSAEAVLEAEIDPVAGRALQVAIVGSYAVPVASADGAGEGGPSQGGAGELGKDVEVRAFYGDGTAVFEDPVTGSANAGLAQWLIGAGRLPDSYVAGQGTRLQRDGRVYVEARDGQVWVGGDTVTTITGEVRLG